MDTNFAVMLSPLGCFTQAHGHVTIQRDAQAYLREIRIEDSQASRRHVVASVLRSRRLDNGVKAAIECHFYRFERVESWHILDDKLKTARVVQFYESIKKAAAGISVMMADAQNRPEGGQNV